MGAANIEYVKDGRDRSGETDLGMRRRALVFVHCTGGSAHLLGRAGAKGGRRTRGKEMGGAEDRVCGRSMGE